MAKLTNKENNIVIELNLIKGERFDVEIGRNDFENWIPFTFNLTVEGKEVYSYTEENYATFSMQDIKFMITRFECAIEDKSKGIELKNIGWAPIEMYFNIELYETYEENEIGFEIWIRVAPLTNGKSRGYERGFDFSVTTDSLKSFIEEIKEQFEVLVGQSKI